ncbi:MAG TPA: cyclic nucleotide-binding domain-containing protein, partial [Hyphomicrobium sp.]|nr:cyclic nucleotide-binding domain-containing protein [Hyphomicrobium sp.]
MSSEPFRLSNVATFSGLSPDHLALLEERLLPIHVPRGTCIVSEGDDADALFVVVSGRFAVEIGGHAEPVTEIGQGATIGEIAFFSGGARTATVRAIRDSVVVQLSRMCFDEITARSPAIWNAIASTLAARLAAQTRQNTALRASPLAKANPSLRPRTVALIRAGPAPVPARFIDNLMRACTAPEGT